MLYLFYRIIFIGIKGFYMPKLKFYLTTFCFISFSLSSYSQDAGTSTKKPLDKEVLFNNKPSPKIEDIKKDHFLYNPNRHLGNILFGVSLGAGFSNDLKKSDFSHGDFSSTDIRAEQYSVFFQSEFILSSFFSLNINFGAERFSFLRNTTKGDISRGYHFKQLQNIIDFLGRFTFAGVFFIDTGPSLVINYQDKASKIGSTNFNIKKGVALNWQFGAGFSKVVSYNKNKPFVSFIIETAIYVPVAGGMVNSQAFESEKISYNIKYSPFQMQLNAGMSFQIS